MTVSCASIHDAHPYPCKYPPHAVSDYIPDSGIVLDPFCGSGTTLVEAALRGATAIGFDCNPIAVLISRFKLLEVDESFKRRGEEFLAELTLFANEIIGSDETLPEFSGRDHWFGKVAQRELASLKRWIDRRRDARVRTWLNLSLSAVINRVSYQDSETRYARTERKVMPGDVVDAFLRHARKALTSLVARGPLKGHGHRIEQADVLAGYPIEDESVDVIVTSPPYANTMDYYLYHKQRMNVLGFDFKEAQREEIGSRWEFSSMRASKSKWRTDYGASLREMRRVLRRGGHAVVIIGDSQIAGELVNAADLTAELAAELRLSSTLIESIPLEARSKSFLPSFQRPNKYEHTIKLVKH
jgi:SAM-dependent methyltransferase